MDYRYTAIVLKKREVGDTDRLYTFYTREAGKIQSLAKGVRKAEAKLASALETLSLVDLMVVKTRGVGKVAGAVLEKSFFVWHRDYTTLALALEVLGTLDLLVDLEEPDELLYQLLLRYLETGEKLLQVDKSEKIPFLTEAFFFQLLSHLGYQLELSQCAVTGAKLTSEHHLALSPSAGGVVIANTLVESNDFFPVSQNIIKLLRLFATQPLEKIERIVAPEQDIANISRFRKIFLQWVRR